MESLLQNFGIDWKVFGSQAVNFLLLVVILRATVYGPLMKVIAERRKKIKDGLAHAEEADRRLADVSVMQKQKEQEAEDKGLRMIKEAQAKAKAEGARELEEAGKKVVELQKRAESAIAAERTSMMQGVEEQAATLVKAVLQKAVSMSPEGIDSALVKKAMSEIK